MGSIYASSALSDRTATRTFEPTWIVPSYWRFDAIAGYRFEPRKGYRCTVALNVKNVLDNTRIYFVATPDRWTIESGREWNLNFSTQF